MSGLLKHLSGNLFSTKALLEKEVKNHTVMVFSKSYCPYCSRVKAAFAAKEVPISVCELDEQANGDNIQAILASVTGLSTVPNVWIGGEFVGDSARTVKGLNAGEFDKKLGLSKL